MGLSVEQGSASLDELPDEGSTTLDDLNMATADEQNEEGTTTLTRKKQEEKQGDILLVDTLQDDLNEGSTTLDDLNMAPADEQNEEGATTLTRKKQEEKQGNILLVDTLHLIFASLRLKVLVRTSVLSKKWSSIWKTMPYLEFRYDDFRGEGNSDLVSYELMMGFVDCFLLLRDNCSVHSFRYQPVYNAEPMRFFTQSGGWILYTLRHNVRILSVWLSVLYSSRVMEPTFNNGNLEDLHIEFYRKNSISPLEFLYLNTLNLPILGNLHLVNVHLVDASMNQILNGCPLLNKLSLESCQLDLTKIETSTIEFLSIKGELGILPDIILNILDAPNITDLSISEEGPTMQDVTFEDMPLIRTARIQLLNESILPNSPSNFRTGGGRILGALSSIQTLELKGPVIPYLLERELGTLPIFLNLMNLELQDFCMVCHFETVIRLLRTCPSMINLKLAHNGDFCMKHDEGTYALTGPSFHSYKLTRIEFHCTSTDVRELVKALKLHSSNGLKNVEILIRDDDGIGLESW